MKAKELEAEWLAQRLPASQHEAEMVKSGGLRPQLASREPLLLYWLFMISSLFFTFICMCLQYYDCIHCKDLAHNV